MVRCVIISLRLGKQVAEFLRQKPEAGNEMVESIFTRINDSSAVRLTRHQVVVVIGNLVEQVPANGAFWYKRTIAIDQYYYSIGDSTVNRATDKGVRRIVDKAIQLCLERLHAWEISL
jgi:hypothetical protein